MALTSGDILVYDGSQWNNQPSTSNAINIDDGTFYLDSVNNRIGIGTTNPSGTFHVKGLADDEHLIVQANSTQTAHVMQVRDSASAVLVAVDASGHLLFGSTYDTNLYRSAANTLKTDDDFLVGSALNVSAANNTLGIGTASPNGKVEIAGTADNEQLIVRAYSTQTNDVFQVRNSSGSRKLGIDGSGKLIFESGGDTNLYRGAANQLKTDDALSVAGAVITPPSALQTLGAGNAISANAAKVRVASSGGIVTLTVTPTIADGSDGQLLIILGTSDTNTVTVQDQGTLPSSNLELGAATRTLGKGDILVLSFDDNDSVWYEVSFVNN